MSHSARHSLELLQHQRSHVLFALSNSTSGREKDFRDWYVGAYRDVMLGVDGVLAVQSYERHEVDIDQGQHPPLPFQYLAFHDISVDGAEAAEAIIESVTAFHGEEPTPQVPATWLCYAVSEKVGRAARRRPSMLAVAFANLAVGQE